MDKYKSGGRRSRTRAKERKGTGPARRGYGRPHIGSTLAQACMHTSPTRTVAEWLRATRMQLWPPVHDVCVCTCMREHACGRGVCIMYTRIHHVRTHTHAHTRTHTHTHTHAYTHIHTHTHAYTHIHTHTHTCTHSLSLSLSLCLIVRLPVKMSMYVCVDDSVCACMSAQAHNQCESVLLCTQPDTLHHNTPHTTLHHTRHTILYDPHYTIPP